MIKKIIMALPLLFLTSSTCLAGGKTLQEMMVQDLETVSYTMEILYGPQEWKHESFGWDLQEETEKAKAKIYANNIQTPKEYQKVLQQFLHSTRDFHVGAGFYSTAFSVFPLSVKEAEGHFYIDEVDPALQDFADFFSLFGTFEPIKNIGLYQKDALKLKVGDEIIAMNGIPLSQLIEITVTEEFGGDPSPTARSLAVKSLFVQSGMSGNETAQGLFTVTVQHQGSNSALTYTFPWFHLQEEIADKSSKKPSMPGSKMEQLVTKYANKDLSVERAEKILKNRAVQHLHKKSTKGIFDERNKGFLPPLGRIVWETDRNGDIYGYIYQTLEGRKIAYLYIDSFDHHEDASKQISAIAATIIKFNRESDALIVDITDNPGGELAYMYAVLSMLTDSPLSTISTNEILVQKNIYSALQWKEAIEKDMASQAAGGTLWGYYYNQEVMQGIIKYCDQIVDNWNSGKTFSDPVYMYGIEKIQPHPKARYKKPILVLTNELSISCGDLFPAILQDNNRATLFGKKTAGAGGTISMYEHNSRFGVMYYTLTNSIHTRSNGQFLENLGVTPDISYELTRNDIKQNYADYIKAVNTAVSGIIK